MSFEKLYATSISLSILLRGVLVKIIRHNSSLQRKNEAGPNSRINYYFSEVCSITVI
jgi:hypothetical protein